MSGNIFVTNGTSSNLYTSPLDVTSPITNNNDNFGTAVYSGGTYSASITNLSDITGNQESGGGGIVIGAGQIENSGVIEAGPDSPGIAGGPGGAIAVTNSGTITGGTGVGDGNVGISLRAGGTVTNEFAATINGSAVGIYASSVAPPTITNQGRITSTGDGINVESRAYISNGTVLASAAYIGGGKYGILSASASYRSASITNFGTISASVGVVTGPGGAVVNMAGATISGVSAGVATMLAASNLPVTNYGTISASTGNAVDLNSGGTVTNGSSENPSGDISGAQGGIYFQSSGSVINFGTITASSGAGIDLQDGSLTVENKPGAYIGGTTYGIRAAIGTATIVNGGTISSAATAVIGAYYVYNQVDGTIVGDVITQTLTNFGTISDPNGIGVSVDGNANDFIDTGNILALVGIELDSGSYGTLSIVGEVDPVIGIRDLTGVPIVNGTQTNTTATVQGDSIGILGQSYPVAVTNYGTISAGDQKDLSSLASLPGPVIPGSAAGAAIYLQKGGSVNNMQDAYIGGGIDGIVIAYPTLGTNAANTVTNAGTIEAKGGTGVYMTGGGIVTNQRNLQNGQYYGLISGYYIGVRIGVGGGSVANSGDIVGTKGIGVQTLGGENVTNNKSGTISGAVYGVLVKVGTGAGTVINSATIQQNGGGSATYAGSTSIAGVEINTSGTVTNSQGGIITGNDGVDITGANALVANTGKIAGGSHDGVFLKKGGVVDNGAGGTNPAPGTITGGVDGVMIIGGTGTVANYNSIAGFGAAGIYLKSGGAVTNAAPANGLTPIISGGYYGVLVAGTAGSVTNFSSIAGNLGFGVDLRNGGTFTNAKGASITGAKDGVTLSGAAVLTNSGSISGGIGVRMNGIAAQTIINYGTITGTAGTAVSLGGSADTLRIEPGSVLNGAVNDFTAGDTIDFADVAATQAMVANGTLTLLNGTQMVGTLLLDPSQVFPNGAFAVTLDGAGDTDVTVTQSTVGAGQSFTVSAGQVVAGLTITSGGTELIAAGGTDNGAVVDGGSQLVFGTAGNATLEGDAAQTVESGGIASFTTVGNTGTQTVLDGGTASGTAVSNGGVAVVSAGGTVTGAMLSGGFLVVSSGAVVNGAISGSGTVELVRGGSVIAGTSGLTISAGSGADTVNALAGGDTVEGNVNGTAIVFGAAGDVVENGAGQVFVTLSGGTNPTIFSLSGGSALLYAGADDTLVGGGGNAIAIGAAGDDFVLGSGNDTVNVIPSGETLTFGSGNAIVYAGPGDTIGDAAGTVVTFTSGGNAIVLAGSGNSVLLYSGPGDTLTGGNAASTVIGAANDEIVLGTGADTVNAFPANEVVELGSGPNETVFGGTGDTIEASGGSPLVTFESGSQGIVFIESAGAEQLYSGPGDTLVIGGGTLSVIGSANNTLTLGSGTDTVNALPPDETVTFGTGNATVFCGDGDTIGTASGTVVVLSAGNNAITVEDESGAVTVDDGAGDTIAGGSASAVIAGAKNSAIVLGSAADTVTGANGDTITTGAGSDSIDLGASHTAAEFLAPGSGTDTSANDTVVNFSQTTGDRILETGTAETNTLASAHSNGGNTTITLSDGSTVILVGVGSVNTGFFG